MDLKAKISVLPFCYANAGVDSVYPIINKVEPVERDVAVEVD